MPINKNFLRAALTRDIPTSELLEKLQKITTTGEEKMAQLDKLAKEVEDTYAAVDGMQKTISLASLKHNIIKGGS